MKAEETVDYHIKSAWHAISRMYNVFSTPHDMTMAIGYVLLNIDKKGTPATKIAPALGLEARSLTRMLKSLEEKNWIRREIDTTDKRVVNVYLTEIGKTKRDLARRAVLEFNNAVQEVVSKEKINDLIDTISRISKVVDAINVEHKAADLEEFAL
jgi:MarR family transcriptional regulator, organic hydroperoxide resistance regulator